VEDAVKIVRTKILLPWREWIVDVRNIVQSQRRVERHRRVQINAGICRVVNESYRTVNGRRGQREKSTNLKHSLLP
jgi:hypothetical protein